MKNVYDFGANGDGIVLDSPAIQSALDAAAKEGGGCVNLPAGIFRCGTLRLPSNTELHLEAGATIRASHDTGDFSQHVVTNRQGKEVIHRHLIEAYDGENITISGRGTIDGQGFAFWYPQTGPREWIKHKPDRISQCLEINRCKNVVIQDITILESPGWTLHLQCCDQVRLSGIRIENNRFGPNNDGFDINGCRDVMIDNCHIDTCDDAIVMKTTHDARSCERITISNCILSCNCAAIKCGTESFFDFRQIVVSNCVVTRSTRAFACYAIDGGTIEQVRIANIVCDTNVAFLFNHPLHLDTRKRESHSKASTIRDIRVHNFSALTDGRLLFTAADGTSIEDIHLDGVSLCYALFCNPEEFAPGSTGHQVSRHSPEARGARAAVVCENVKGLHLRDFQLHWPESQHYPGWGEGARRIENGGSRITRPADQGDDVAFSVLWAKGCNDCSFELGSLQPSDQRADAIMAENNNNLTFF